MVYVQLAAGFLLLLVGGEALVRGAVSTARRFGVSPLLIGLTLVGFGTSMPELITSLEAVLVGSPGLAVGNVVGSNIANILLILGVASLIWPMRCDPGAFYRDGAVIVVSAVAFIAVCVDGVVERGAGIAFVGLLLLYVCGSYLMERRHPDASAQVYEHEEAAMDPAPQSLWLALLCVLGGIAITIAGAKLLVAGAIDLARDFGVSETVIGLTVVAVGTSLPELATSVVAAFRRQPDVAFGNIVGSNIFNIFGILGITAIVSPLPLPPEIVRFDLWVLLGATGLLIAFTVTGWRLVRVEGAIFLAAYVAYIGYLAAGV